MGGTLQRAGEIRREAHTAAASKSKNARPGDCCKVDCIIAACYHASFSIFNNDIRSLLLS